MPRFLLAFVLLFCVVNAPLHSQDQKATAPGHYLFAWAGDAALKGNDFLAVIDADPFVRLIWTFGDDGCHRSTDPARAPHGVHHARQRHALRQRS